MSQPILLLNGKTQQGSPNNSSAGLTSLKDLRIPQPSLGKTWLLTWTHSSQRDSDPCCYNMWTIAFGCQEWRILLGRDQGFTRAVDGVRLLSLEKEGTDLQRGGKIFGVCSERRHQAVRPVEKRGHFENPTTKNQMTVWEFLGATEFCRIWILGYSQMVQYMNS